ncbi:glutamate racemase [Rhizobium leguminosarum]|uniref:glutamate racemase n=1 Tax=Rhizobium leguminosarum TaxID=384 RepID=UPI003F9BF28C
MRDNLTRLGGGDIAPISSGRVVGIFDSGVGGLTVLRSVRKHSPASSFIYLGDTARLPYGTKSKDTIIRYTVQAVRTLVGLGATDVILACNTASAQALASVKERCPGIRVYGTIEPTVHSAVRLGRKRILLMATEGTVKSAAYQEALAKLSPSTDVVSIPCGLLVALAEEGWFDGDVARSVLNRYLGPYLNWNDEKSCVVLGCTHFPLLLDPIRQAIGSDIPIIDAGEETAKVFVADLETNPSYRHGRLLTSSTRFLTTDNPERFARVAALFLGTAIPSGAIETIDLD